MMMNESALREFPNDLADARAMEAEMASEIRALKTKLDTARQEVRAGIEVDMAWFRRASYACSKMADQQAKLRQHIGALKYQQAIANRDESLRIKREKEDRKRANSEKAIRDLTAAHKEKLAKMQRRAEAAEAEVAVLRAQLASLLGVPAPSVAANFGTPGGASH